MKCPKCGAENADHLFYCGSCASSLRDIPARNSETSKQEVTSEGGLDSASAHKAKVQQSMRRIALMVGAMSALWLFLTTDPILRGELGYDDIIQVSLAGFLAVAAVYTYWASTNDEVLTFIRLVGWAGNTSAEVSGFSLNQMLIVLTAMVAGSALSLLTFAASDIPVASAVIIAIAGLIVSVVFYRSRVTLEDIGICIGSK